MWDGLRDSLVEVIKEASEGQRVGIACSGGLDSGLVSALSKQYAESVTLYTCGTANAFDVSMAKDLSKRLNLPFVHAQISKSTIVDLIKEFITATGVSDPFTISYELQLFCVCKEAEEEIIITGQGADEYFMGCAKYVGQTREEFELLKDAGVERLMNVSVPCEKAIADYFGKTLIYPYLDDRVLSEISKIDPETLIPEDMDSRKQVLKDVASDLGYGFLADRKKKSSQYGSGTTDLVRAVARERGVGYANLISILYDEVVYGSKQSERGAVVNARIDPIIKLKAEKILMEKGLSPSEAIEKFYLNVIKENEKED
ncbi:MAG: type II toxin-antitoxin system RelB/DinJ family antitoxin [Candidatus Methanomethylophilaceae archaeon]|nr:type II toxin-antitoxin system RelB/DinJ family antitoxin [Candidatus Methanomethylophilaceae archaeon]